MCALVQILLSVGSASYLDCILVCELFLCNEEGWINSESLVIFWLIRIPYVANIVHNCNNMCCWANCSTDKVSSTSSNSVVNAQQLDKSAGGGKIKDEGSTVSSSLYLNPHGDYICQTRRAKIVICPNYIYIRKEQKLLKHFYLRNFLQKLETNNKALNLKYEK